MQKKSIALIVVAVAAFLWLTFPVFRVGNSAPSSQVLWHDDEAIVVVQHRLTGWSMSRIKMVVGSLGAFGVASQDFKLPVAVFRITPTSVEEHRFDQYRWAIELMVAHGQPHTGQLRWTGNDFVPDKLPAFPAGFPRGAPDAFSNVDGWSKRSFLSPEEGSHALETEFSLHGHAERLITTTRDGIVSIDLDRRDGAALQRLISIDTRHRSVSPDEYESLLRK